MPIESVGEGTSSILHSKRKGTKYIINYVPHAKHVLHVSLNYIFNIIESFYVASAVLSWI